MLYSDIRIGRLELLDQLVHRIDALLERVLPVFDLDSLGAGGYAHQYRGSEHHPK